jgi:hypothetical protein
MRCIYLFTCGLFNDAVSSSQYTASNNKINKQRTGQEVHVTSQYLLGETEENCRKPESE